MAKEDPEENQSASEFIAEFADGDMDTELTQTIRSLIDTLRTDAMRRGRESKSKGELNLKLRFIAECTGGRDVSVDVFYEINRKEPKPQRSTDLYFVGRKGGLTRE